MNLNISCLLVMLYMVPLSFLGRGANYHFKHLTTDNGLAHTDALACVQDEFGFIWIATNGGLQRYDGYSFQSFYNEESQIQSVYNNRIHDLSLGNNGLLWIASEGGIKCFDTRSNQFKQIEINGREESILLNQPTFSVSAGPDKSLFLINEAGLFKISLDAFEVVSFVPLFLKDIKNTAYSEIRQVDGAIWATFQKGIVYVDKDRTNERNGGIEVKLRDLSGGKYPDVFTIYQTSNNDLLVGVNGGYLKLLSNRFPSLSGEVLVGEFYPIRKDVSIPKGAIEEKEHVLEILEDSKKNLWLGTNAGLIKMSPGKTSGSYEKTIYKKSYYDPKTISSDHISHLMSDKSGNLWISTYAGGLNILNLSQHQFSIISKNSLPMDNSISEDFVRAIAEDMNGDLWLGTRSFGMEIFNLEKGLLNHYSANSGQLTSNNIRSIVMDKKGRGWIGTDRGITVLDNKLNSSVFITSNYQPGNNLSNDVIFALDVDIYGQVWAGSWHNGLNRIKELANGQFEIQNLFQSSDGLCSDRISFIYADKQRPEIFVSTNKGLNHILLDSLGEIKNIYKYVGFEKDPNSLSSNFVWPIARGDENTIWVGTLGGGLNKVTLMGQGRYTSQRFGPKDGLPSNDIESLLLDNQGRIWMGTRGLSMYDPDSERFTNFDHLSGLQGNSFKIGSALKSKDGTMFFGGINGITYFHPDSINYNADIPKVVFTDLWVNNKKVVPGELVGKSMILDEVISIKRHVDLKYFQNDFSIFFSSLQYHNTDKVKYKYRLVGFDKEFNYTNETGNRSASYINLDYGDYLLEVYAANELGEWSFEPAIISFTISPPFWWSTWAILFYVLVLVSFIIGVLLLQKRWFKMKGDLEYKILEDQKVEEIHNMRLQFFTNISHEFKTPLTLILSPLDKIISGEYSEQQFPKFLSLMKSNADRLLHLINELMDFRKVESGVTKLQVKNTNVISLTKGIISGFESMSDQKGVKLSFDSNLDSRDIWIDPRIYEKVLINLISNAFRYTKNGEISISLSSKDPHPSVSFEKSYLVGEKNLDTDYLEFRIADTGVGISRFSIESIFDRYYRISDNKDQHLGSGIGLALVKSLILCHKGAIEVNSERGKGSIFIAYFPYKKNFYCESEIATSDLLFESDSVEIIQDEFDESKCLIEKECVDLSLPKVLIVDDNPEVLSFLKDCFSNSYSVFEAENGIMGLEMVNEHYPDIIISDVMMPEMDGMEFCAAVKSDSNISHIPVILLTAKSSEESRIQGAEFGADAYISKPFNPTLLEKTVSNILETRAKLKEKYGKDTFIEERELVTNKRDKDFLDQLILIINDNIDDFTFDIDHLCMEMGNSRTKLYNKIRGLTGLSLGEFIRRMRMKKAAEILLKEDISVAEVMTRVGIQSQSYFTKTFKNEFGVTPAQYSRKLLKEH
jgi:signal transduction histidine kinase/DNA-binding response OmpR family regulator/ligand-binding sensor domain-containing protein